tara:strand:- start:643 stop:903 length:261 start_codon:yes stop_codon:yes gene_type:complete
MENTRTLYEYMNSLSQQDQQAIKEYNTIRARCYRNDGINIIHKKGRKKVSESHKKRTAKSYYQKKKDEKIANGTYKPPGRPKTKQQ